MKSLYLQFRSDIVSKIETWLVENTEGLITAAKMNTIMDEVVNITDEVLGKSAVKYASYHFTTNKVLSTLVAGAVIDTATLVEHDVVMLSGQAGLGTNGLWLIQDGVDPIRPKDFDTAEKLNGTLIMVNNLLGTQSDRLYQCLQVGSAITLTPFWQSIPLEQARYRGIVLPASAVPVNLVNGDWVRCTANGTYTNFDAIYAYAQDLLAWDGNSSQWTLAPVGSLSDIILSANIDANGFTIEDLALPTADGEAVSFEVSEAEAIQLLQLHNPDLVFSGFVNVASSTPSFSLNKAYIAVETGTVLGISAVKGQIIKDTGSAFVAEDQFITLVKGDVGLGNVDNTSDANKPVSTAQQTVFDLKAPVASPTFTGTVGGVTKAMVGLGNVDNTSDANKPISTAQQTAFDLKADLVAGTVPASQLPSYVDDVIEVADFASLPVTGETGKIYVTIDDNKSWRWSGTIYVQIASSLELGETAGSAYRGDRGKTAYDHSQVAHAPAAAEENVKSDWDAVTGDAEIENKPTLGTAAAEDVEAFDAAGTAETEVEVVTDLLAECSCYRYALEKARALAESGGSMGTVVAARAIISFMFDQDLLKDTKLLISPWLSRVVRESGIYKYFPELLSIEDENPHNDAVQTIELSQPYESWNIAPNEVASLNNPNGDSRYMTHPAISILSSTAWSLVFVLNWNGSENVHAAIFGKQSDTESIISLRDGSTNRLKLINDSAGSGTGAQDISGIIGKHTVIQLDANRAGSLDVSLNGSLLETISVATDIEVSAIFKAMATAGSEYHGRLSYAHLITQNLTALAATYAAFLRTLIPEIESVQIGSQEWATSNLDIAATPEGNVINKVELAVDTEKTTVADDRDFSSDTGFWTKGANITIPGDGLCHYNAVAAGQYLRRSTLLSSIGSWHKVGYEIKNHVSGTFKAIVGGVSSSISGGDGVFVGYIKSINTDSRYENLDANGVYDLDNVSVEEVGWAGLGDLYTWLVDPAGGNYSVADALKEAAGWCYFDNDPAIGAIYGKLYNWFAVSLINTDMGTAAYGWHTLNDAESVILDTTVSSDSDTLKENSDKYWNTPNMGNNSTGLTLLPAGYRDVDGAFYDLTNLMMLWSSDDSITTPEKVIGMSIRIVKD